MKEKEGLFPSPAWDEVRYRPSEDFRSGPWVRFFRTAARYYAVVGIVFLALLVASIVTAAIIYL